MFQKILFTLSLCMILGEAVLAENEIDSFVSTRCNSVCMGESEECRQCYTQAVSLFDQQQSGDLDLNSNGRLEVAF